MTKADKYMYEAIQNILSNGYKDENPRPHYADGTPAHTLSVNHVFRTYDLSKGEFPICTLRPIAWKTGIREILWIYQMGSSSLEDLHNLGVRYWDKWESKDRPGTIGQRYGETVDKHHLIEKLIADIQNDPFGRRKVMSLWQEEDLAETDGLAPCAFLTIWNVRKSEDDNYYLDMVLVQRSGDMLTASGAGGINETQYASLLMMIARHAGYQPGVFSHFIANEQIYTHPTHLKAAQEMQKRYNDAVIVNSYDDGTVTFNYETKVNPQLILNPAKTDFYQFNIKDFQMVGYNPIHPNFSLELGI